LSAARERRRQLLLAELVVRLERRARRVLVGVGEVPAPQRGLADVQHLEQVEEGVAEVALVVQRIAHVMASNVV
jgi:hypothetical protein